MGQQQLLLLVLGIVIVGLAVVVGIQAFGENQKKANADALVNDAIRIASDAQAWRLKPAAFGGGAGNAAATPWTADNAFSLEQVGYEVAAGIYTNLNGDFAAPAADPLVITGCSPQAYGNTFNRVEVTVSGTGPEDIATVVSSPTTCTP